MPRTRSPVDSTGCISRATVAANRHVPGYSPPDRLIVDLRVADVDFLRGVVNPEQRWPGVDLKTEGSKNPVPIPRDLTLLLAASVEKYPSDMMVTNGDGSDRAGPWLIERAFRDVRAEIEGLPDTFTFHDLRHYLASMLIHDGNDIKTVHARMRHASARTTLDTYGTCGPMQTSPPARQSVL